MPLVRVIARRVRRSARSVSEDELIAIGYATLVERAPHYDRSVGAFDDFVALRVRGAMLDHIRKTLKDRGRSSELAALSIPSPLPRRGLDDLLASSTASDRADVLDSVELAMIGGVAAYLGGGHTNHVEDETVDHLYKQQLSDATRRFVDDLGEPEPTLFKQHFLAGLQVADVAKQVAIPLRSAERALRNLRVRLREHLMQTALVGEWE